MCNRLPEINKNGDAGIFPVYYSLKSLVHKIQLHGRRGKGSESFSREKSRHATPVAPVAQRYHVTSDTLGREFDPGKRDFSH